jgi:hypothetical protein
MHTTATTIDSEHTVPTPLVLVPPVAPTEDPAGTATTVVPTVNLRTEREEILAVLDQAARDPGYIAQLTYNPGKALEGYALSQAAKGALVCGDVRWVEAHVGKLDTRLRTWLDCRLQQEIW